VGTNSVAAVTDFAAAAAVLVAEGIKMVVVGSAALAIHGENLEVHDLDVVIYPSPANLSLVGNGLAALGAAPGDVPSLQTLRDAEVVGVVTGYGRVDLLLDHGRRRFPELARRSKRIDICGVEVPVADCQEAWALRARFKEPAGLQ
jgi:hypothetical protein